MFDEMQDQSTRTTEDYLGIVRRQRWVILGSAFFCWLLVWVVGWLLPSQYQSDAVIAIQQQQVSTALVEPNAQETAASQLEAVRTRVINPASLQGIIDEDHLYRKHRGLLALFDPADPVKQMQKDIQFGTAAVGQRNGNEGILVAFVVSYTAKSPQLAQQVDQQLSTLFVQENNAIQTTFSKTTTDFLSTQLEEAQNDLNTQDKAVKEFKAQHMGELPDQVQSNLQVLSGLQQQLQSTDNALSAAQGQKLYLESLVQQYQSAQSDLGSGDSASPSSLEKQLKDLQMQLAQERSQYTDNYPDVIALKEQIAKTEELKKQSEDQIAKDRKSGAGSDGLSAGSALDVQNGAPTPMMQIQSQLKSNQLQIQGLQAAQKSLQTKIGMVQARLDAAPAVEQQLSEISRGYTEAETNYNQMRQKVADAKLAANYQTVQDDKQYRIQSPATFPLQPAGPNHVLISLGGLAAGIFLGVVLAVIFEFTDVRIRKETDLEGIVSARVLVGIPKMSTAAENRRHAMLRWIEGGAALAMLVIVVAGNIYSFYRG